MYKITRENLWRQVEFEMNCGPERKDLHRYAGELISQIRRIIDAG
jgi:hypothetical protein